jgi:hypothetical protein
MSPFAIVRLQLFVNNSILTRRSNVHLCPIGNLYLLFDPSGLQVHCSNYVLPENQENLLKKKKKFQEKVVQKSPGKQEKKTEKRKNRCRFKILSFPLGP